MIELLKGTCVDRDNANLIIDVSGVGYGVEIPKNLFNEFNEGEDVTVWIHTHVKEDVLKLYGFEKKLTRDLFRMLLSLSGVGPKVGLAIISCFSVKQLLELINKEDSKTLESVPGVGARQSKKIIIEAKPKVKKFLEQMPLTVSERQPVLLQTADESSELICALEGLGYKKKEIEHTIKKIAAQLSGLGFQESFKLVMAEMSAGMSQKIKKTDALAHSEKY